MGRALLYFHIASIQTSGSGFLSREQRILGGDCDVLSRVHTGGPPLCALGTHDIGGVTAFKTSMD